MFTLYIFIFCTDAILSSLRHLFLSHHATSKIIYYCNERQTWKNITKTTRVLKLLSINRWHSNEENKKIICNSNIAIWYINSAKFGNLRFLSIHTHTQQKFILWLNSSVAMLCRKNLFNLPKLINNSAG